MSVSNNVLVLTVSHAVRCGIPKAWATQDSTWNANRGTIFHGGPSIIAINTRTRKMRSPCFSRAYNPACRCCICKSSISGLPTKWMISRLGHSMATHCSVRIMCDCRSGVGSSSLSYMRIFADSFSCKNVVEIRLKYGLPQSTTIASDNSRTWSSSTMGRRPPLGLSGLKRLNAVTQVSLAVRHEARPSTLL